MSNIDIRITRARSQLIQKNPFFGCLCMRLVVRERNDVQTMATDGKFLFYCKAFLDKVSELELLFVVAHEVLHCALSHMTRRVNRRWDLWQAATDYVVNLMLHQAGFKVPTWVKYFDARFAGLSVETIYRMLENEEQKKEEDKCDESAKEDTKPNGGTSATPQDENVFQEVGSGSDQSPLGEKPSESLDGNSTQSSGENLSEGGAKTGRISGDGSHIEEVEKSDYAKSYGDPGGCGEVLDAAPPHDKAALAEVADEWQVYTRQAANIARRQGEGRLPGFIEEIIEVLNDPKTNWREQLRRFVDPSNTKDYAWSNPNRRMMALGYYTPGMISNGVSHVGMLVDSSGSVDSLKLQLCGTEIQSALDEGAIDKLTLIFIDTQVHKVVEYNKGDVLDFTVLGRGGTAFSPGFKYVNENLPDVSVVIFFTDLECSDFGEQPTYPVLWAVHGEDPRMIKKYMARVPFGECIQLQQ